MAGTTRSRRSLVIAAIGVTVILTGCTGSGGGGGSSSNNNSGSGSGSAGGSGSSRVPSPAGQQIIPSTPTGPVTVAQTPERVPNTTGVKGVLAWDTQGWPGDGRPHPGALQHDHVSGPVTYAVTPPVGGPHNPVWMNAGVYTEPVPSERAVHNLEHGAVWITYAPGLPKGELKQLTDFVTGQSWIPEGKGQANRYIDLSPWAGGSLPSPIVLSAWGYQLRLDKPDGARMQKFVDTFRHSSKYTPEYGAAVDGIPVLTGGRPAFDGSKLPNPPGRVQGQGG